MNNNYEYLQDLDFLLQIDTLPIKEQYIKLIALDWEENPIQEIHGFATSGSINLDGDAAMRRTCSLGIQIPAENYSRATNVNNLFSINKKVYIEVGIKNTTNKYQEYPIIWFPLGLFVMIGTSLSHTAEGITLSLQLRDKMSFLNGDCGGTIPASTHFDTYETFDEYGNLAIERPIISQIIREAVNHFGGEQLGKIIISDIPDKIKQVVKWVGSTPLYFKNTRGNYLLTSRYEDVKDYAYHTYEYGDDVGYIYTDFTYPGELIENAGSNVVALLDKIKTTLGNYEYYYDVHGNFIWQEIKNYLNTTQATIDLEQLKEKEYSLKMYDIENLKSDDYLLDMTRGKSLFDFKDSKMISSYSNSPQFNNIKNDFIVWGTRKTSEGVSIPIRFHLAIDKKPETGVIRHIFFYNDPEDGLVKPQVATPFTNKDTFPEEGQVLVHYLDLSTGLLYRWIPPTASEEKGKYVQFNDLEVQLFTSYADFPTQGEDGILYIDSTTKKHYIWDIDENSQHYKDVQEEKKNTQEAYIIELGELNNEKRILEDNIIEAENSIIRTTETIAKLEEAQVTKDKDAINRQKDVMELQALREAELDKLAIAEDATIASIESTFGSYPFEDPVGEYGKGNINLYKRTVVKHPTEELYDSLAPMKFKEEDMSSPDYGKYIVIPLVINNEYAMPEAALGHYYYTEEFLGKFDTAEKADYYIALLNLQQKTYYATVHCEIGEKDYYVIQMLNEILPMQEEKVANLTVQTNVAAELYEQALKAQQDNLTALEAARNQMTTLTTSKEQYETEKAALEVTIQEKEEERISRMEELAGSEKEYIPANTVKIEKVQSTDWRTELYLQGVEAEVLGLDSNHYYAELKAEWPKLYDLKKNSYTDENGDIVYTGGFIDGVLEYANEIDYWLDFIDTDSDIDLLNVNNIGRRSIVISSNDVNCIFECHIPDLVIIDKNAEDKNETMAECSASGQGYVIVDPAVYGMLAIGGTQRSAYEEIKTLLFKHTRYNESIQLSTIPLYHLEPNTRISVVDPDSDIYGDYIINSISLPFDINGTSSISAVRHIEKM